MANYAVDFVIEVMRKISSVEPALFQRDGSLYVASPEGFGQVTYGSITEPVEIRSWEEKDQPPEIRESIDAIIKLGAEGRYTKPQWKAGEGKYFQKIAFGQDDDQFTLEDLIGAALALAKLPDDGRIRMIQHASGYHSHKYGYAADGIDVNVIHARVMAREKYLEFLREKESKLIQGIEQLGAVEKRDIDENYKRLTFPDCVIITPYLMVSLPRNGTIHLHRDEPDSWTENTRLASHHSGSIMYYQNVSSCEESPFNVQVTLNARNFHGKKAENIRASAKKVSENVSMQLEAVASNMPLAQKFIESLNDAHNRICAQSIKWRKELRQGGSARARAP